jgi:hypothetical protein
LEAALEATLEAALALEAEAVLDLDLAERRRVDIVGGDYIYACEKKNRN